MLFQFDFDIAAMCLLVICYIYVQISFNTKKESTRQYKNLLMVAFIAATLDTISCITISYADMFPLWINYIVNSAYYASAIVASYYLPHYIRFLLEKPDLMKLMDRINDVLMTIVVIICATNPFTHLLCYFSEDLKYEHGPIYLLIYILPAYFILLTASRAIFFRKQLTKRQFVAIISFICIGLSSMLIQLLMPTVLITYFASALGMFIILYSLETPDYQKLMTVMSDLEVAKEDALQARNEAIRSNMAKSNFLANMSHEIRTPINGILGMNEIALNENTDTQIEEYLLNIQDAGQSLLGIINDILDFSKIESGKMEIHPREYKLSEILYSVNNLLNSKANEKGLTFIVENNPDIPNNLLGDDTRIRQVMVNIINNGIKYTKKGSVKLFVDYEENNKSEITLIIKVSDTGIGISSEDLPKLFTSYQRMDEELNRNVEGTGLGLSITKQLTELMNGSIEVESIYGNGSTFIVKIPQQIINNESIGMFGKETKHANKKTDNPLISQFKAPEATLLIVDDIELNRKVMAGLLKNTMMKIDEAKDGFECLQKCDLTKYDIIFLDHMMPGLDGVETLKRIKEKSSNINVDTPVIVLTANAMVGAKEEYMAKGFTDFLAKPIDSNLLYESFIKYLPSTKYASPSNNEETIDDENVVAQIKKLSSLLDINEGIKHCANQKNLYLDVVNNFADEHMESELTSSFFKLDWKNYGILAHGLKSSSKTIGAKDFSNFARRMEIACKEERVEKILSNHDTFIEEYLELKKEINKLLEK